MRWCILPAHTHSQIRLDLEFISSIAKTQDRSAADVPRHKIQSHTSHIEIQKNTDLTGVQICPHLHADAR